MKNKLLKITSVVIIICMIATIFIPFSVKSSQTTLTNMYNTGRGVGNTSIWKTTIKGYSNSYCLRGGAHLYTGAQLNDKGSIYTNSFTDITSNQSAIRWILDNIYLDEGVDNTAKSYMIHNLKQIVSEYAAKKDSDGKSWLAKSVEINSIDDNWVNNAVNAVISDKDTLYAVQQYAIWNFVKNDDSKYTNALQNSDGSYNKLPGAKIDKQYYIGYYVVLREMAKLAQRNNYVSPNSNGKFGISLEKDSSAKVTLQNDKKTVLMGPYTLKNNHSQAIKTLTATVNSENAGSIQAVNEKGQAVDIKTHTGKFYFKVTYNKKFSKGVNYKIKVNIKVTGYKTFANILYPSGSSKQPVVSVRKEAYNTNLQSELSYREEMTGKYNLEILKTGNDNKALAGVKFKVKQTGQTEKEYGPSNNNGIVSVIQNKEIKKAEQVSYIITEIKTSDNTYALLADPFQINITLGVQNEEYKPTKVAFTNGTNKKEMKLKNGTVVTLLASISGNTVRVTVPNRKISGSYSLELIKKDENGKAVSGVTFGVQDGTNQVKSYGPTGSTGIVNVASKTITAAGTDEYTITEIKANNNYITLKDALKLYVTKEIKNYKFEATKVSFEKSKVVTSKQVSLKDGSKVTVNAKLSNGKISVTIPNKKIEGNYSLEIQKVDENNKPLSGVNFKISENSNAVKTYGPTNASGIVNIVNNKKITTTGVDEYTIKEVSSKNNKYITLKDDLKVYVTKEVKNYKYVASKVSFDAKNTVTTKEVSLNNGTKVKVTLKIQNGKITLTVPNKKIEGNYGIEIKKIDLENSKPLSGAYFTVKEGTAAAKQYGPTNAEGKTTIVSKKAIAEPGTDEYTISEVKINDDYIILKDSFKIYVTKEIKDYKYVASKVSFESKKDVTTKQVTLKDGSKVNITAKVDNGNILITVPNKKISGSYSLEIEKINSENSSEKLAGIKFKVQEGSNQAKQYGPTKENGKVTIFEGKKITAIGIDEYTITELELNQDEYYQVKDNIERNGFIKLKDSFKIYITKTIKDNKYQVTKVSFEKEKEVRTKKVILEDGTKVTLTASLTGNTVKVTIPNKPDTKQLQFDMALRKYITKVTRNGKNINIGENRKPVINEFSAKEYEETKTAGYYHTKNPVTVKPGDIVQYSLRIYNEGEIAGFAKEITDYLPAGLEFLEGSAINKENNWTAIKNEDGTTTVKTDKLKNTLIKPANGAEGFSDYAKLASKKDPEFSKYVQIECKIKSNIQDKKLLVNVAEITNYGYNNDKGEYIQANKKNIDIDSIQNNVFSKIGDITNIDEYYEKTVVPQYKDDSKNYKGLEDDDDFENVYVEPDEIEIKFVLNKVDQDGKPLIGADFTVERQKDDESQVLLNNEEVKGTYEVIESDVRYNKTYSYKVIEVESAPEYVNVMEGKFITLRTYMGENNKLVLGNFNKVEEEDSLINKFGFIINNEDGSIVKENETDLYTKIKVEVKNNSKPAQIVITIPNEKVAGNYSLELVKVNSENTIEKLEGVTFKVQEGQNEAKEYGPTNKDGKVTVADNKEITGLGIDEYTISEINLNPEDYVEVNNNIKREGFISLKESFKIYITKDVIDNSYKASKVSFENDKEIKTKKVTLEDGTKVTLKAEIANNTVKITIPNKPILKQLNFDLALRKYITKVTRNGQEINIGESRIPVINEFSAKEYEETKTAGYYHTKNPVTVKPGDVVLYTLRVYNEGDIEGFAKEITDYLPAGLEFVEESMINKENNWTVVKNEDGTTTVKTDKLKNTSIKPANGAEGFSDYAKLSNQKDPEFSKFVQVECKVNNNIQDAKLLVNVAEITNYGYNNDEGEYIEANKEKVDIDSQENNVFTKNDNTKNINEYYENIVVPQNKETNKSYKGIEDDDDFESIYVRPEKFDLALRKFITGVTKHVGTEEQKQTDIINRIPTFKINENGKYVYEHTKEPLVVANGNIVTYTLRVYNEGNVDGYAKLIKDDIPEGLEFLPDQPLNKVFRWVMLDKDGKETNEVKNAVYVASDYLSKEQEKEIGENLIKAFDKEAYETGKIKEPNYKEVKVSFKVNKKDKFDEIVINKAQISKHSDANGNEDVKDIDSEPDKWIDGEDDQDIEKVKVQYFDLSLRKWVTKAITIEDGKQTVTETGHKAEDDPEQIVKVDLKESNIKNVTVKFEYSIRVKNEGQIAGYAKEISDYIPQGLKFVKEDNPDWKEQDGKVVTEKLKDTLLKPGETGEVTILLTWINDSKNMGLKVNTAEISKDYNEEGSPDIDSVPDNKVPGEDDIDDAPVMLTVKTGQEVTYFALAGVVFVMLASGTVIIRKFVLK